MMARSSGLGVEVMSVCERERGGRREGEKEGGGRSREEGERKRGGGGGGGGETEREREREMHASVIFVILGSPVNYSNT